MTEAIAIVSILSGAAVAILVPFINARLERGRMEQQVREARMQEFRSLLDDAAQHLYQAFTILYEVDQDVPKPLPRSDASSERLRQLAGRLTDQVDTLSHDSMRLRVRTSPESPIAEMHLRAKRPVDDYELDFRLFVESERIDQESPPLPPTNDVRRSILKFVDEIRTFAGVVEEPARSTARLITEKTGEAADAD